MNDFVFGISFDACAFGFIWSRDGPGEHCGRLGKAASARPTAAASARPLEAAPSKLRSVNSFDAPSKLRPPAAGGRTVKPSSTGRWRPTGKAAGDRSVKEACLLLFGRPVPLLR